MEQEQEADYYELLGLQQDAGLKQINTAYRQKSLTVHPDRNPDNPNAAQLFHQLTVAYETLKDPTNRGTYDTARQVRLARKAKFAHLDKKRQDLAKDLQAREEAFKKEQTDKRDAATMREAQLAHLREQGKRLREKRQQKLDCQAQEAAKRTKISHSENNNSMSIQLGPLDTSVRLKWTRKQVPSLESKEAIENLATTVGQVDHVIISTDLSDKAKPKTAKALVAFKTLSSAVKAVSYSLSTSKSSWKDITVTWAAGNPPEILSKASYNQSSSLLPPKTNDLPQNSNEEAVLESLRERERERERRQLEDEILKAEEDGT